MSGYHSYVHLSVRPPSIVSYQDNLRVERLNLESVDITDEGIQHLAEMLIENITITHLVGIIKYIIGEGQFIRHSTMVCLNRDLMYIVHILLTNFPVNKPVFNNIPVI